ncbi:MAG: matrixin family metalloprotease [Actinomycetota bacterium]
MNNPSQLWGVAASEMGHVLGLNHTGRTDSIMYPNENPPTMTRGNCFADVHKAQPDLRTLTNDDRAALLQREGEAQQKEMVRDPSFESGVFWNVVNAKAQRLDGGPWGSYHLEFDGTKSWGASDPYISQKIRVHDLGQYDLALQAKVPEVDAQGVAVMEAFVQFTSFGNDPEKGFCDMPPYGSSVRKLISKVALSHEWAEYHSTQDNLPDNLGSACDPTV